MEAVSGWRLAVSKRKVPTAFRVELLFNQTATSRQHLLSDQPLTANR